MECVQGAWSLSTARPPSSQLRPLTLSALLPYSSYYLFPGPGPPGLRASETELRSVGDKGGRDSAVFPSQGTTPCNTRQLQGRSGGQCPARACCVGAWERGSVGVGGSSEGSGARRRTRSRMTEARVGASKRAVVNTKGLLPRSGWAPENELCAAVPPALPSYQRGTLLAHAPCLVFCIVIRQTSSGARGKSPCGPSRDAADR